MLMGVGARKRAPHPHGFGLWDGVEQQFHFILQLKTTVEEVDL